MARSPARTDNSDDDNEAGTETGTDAPADDLETALRNYLSAQFPQIALHGGAVTIHELDPDAGRVSIELGGACHGCAISPMTVSTLKHRIPDEFPSLTDIRVVTGDTATRTSTTEPDVTPRSPDDVPESFPDDVLPE